MNKDIHVLVNVNSWFQTG